MPKPPRPRKPKPKKRGPKREPGGIGRNEEWRLTAGKVRRHWPPKRRARFVRLWTQSYRTSESIRDEINAIPAERPVTIQMMRVTASLLRVRRPVSFHLVREVRWGLRQRGVPHDDNYFAVATVIKRARLLDKSLPRPSRKRVALPKLPPKILILRVPRRKRRAKKKREPPTLPLTTSGVLAFHRPQRREFRALRRDCSGPG